MSTNAKVTFYSISRCGYYKGRGTTFAFCDLAKAMQDLSDWAHGKTVAETKLFSGSLDASALPVYLFEATKLNKGWLLTFWNQTSITDGRVTSVSGSAKVGAGSISTLATKQGDIPGYPSYYWVCPAVGKAASISFFTMGTNHPGMQRYLASFLAIASPHVVVSLEGKQDADADVLGYAEKPGGAIVSGVSSFFRSSIVRRGGEIEHIRKNSDQIRRIHRRTKLDKARTVSVDIWQRALEWTHLKRPVDMPKGIRIQYNVNVKGLTADETDGIISAWDQESGSADAWDDYGFVLAGDSKIYWLGGSLVRQELTFNVIVNSDSSIINLESLATELNAKHQLLLKLLP